MEKISNLLFHHNKDDEHNPKSIDNAQTDNISLPSPSQIDIEPLPALGDLIPPPIILREEEEDKEIDITPSPRVGLLEKFLPHHIRPADLLEMKYNVPPYLTQLDNTSPLNQTHTPSEHKPLLEKLAETLFHPQDEKHGSIIFEPAAHFPTIKPFDKDISHNYEAHMPEHTRPGYTAARQHERENKGLSEIAEREEDAPVTLVVVQETIEISVKAQPQILEEKAPLAGGVAAGGPPNLTGHKRKLHQD